ncbi:MAG: histidine kinase [Flavobacteriia bacterium]|nr:histidine kinase [Flavobacteriia bacterium]
METKRLLYWSAQLIGWTIYSALLILATYAQNPDELKISLYLKIIILDALAIFLTNLMRKTYIRLNWLDLKLPPLLPRVIISTLTVSVFFTLIYEGICYLIDINNGEYKETSFLNFYLEIFSIMVLVLFWNALYFTYHFFMKSRKQELNNIILEANRNEIELKNLRSQLNPHFLFNSLNSIRALIEIEPNEAKKSITSLSNLLRKSLMYGKQNLISLENEIEMVNNYLELEKIRFEERLKVIWLVDESLYEFMIPPFCIQMLVENAIKHGISELINGGEIQIKIGQTENDIYMIIENTGLLKKSKDIGIGIENTKRRLDLQFKGKAQFNIYQEENKVVSSINFKK